MAGKSRGMIRIGGGGGYWGDWDMALPQLLAEGGLDYVTFDYLAEITMSILARARAKNPDAGYATDFVSAVVAPNLARIAASGVKLIANAGGVNPQACAAALRELVAEAGLKLKIATVLGDDLTKRAADFANESEMFSGKAFPDPKSVASVNVYLGAFPIAAALRAGADIVVTGRCVDSALTLGACIHAFDWGRDDWDRLAAGSLAGHMLECGPQANGGNFTDWEEVEASLPDVGYPIAEISADGAFRLTKPKGTGGKISFGAAAEQLLYEIGDPRRYVLPDVICDFSEVTLQQIGDDVVAFAGARGRPRPNTYKTSVTFNDGWKISTLWFFIGEHASAKARSFARSLLERTERKLRAGNLEPFAERSVEGMGDESHFGVFGNGAASREVALKIAAKHADPRALTLLLKEGSALALAAPPGLALYAGGRPSPSPVVRLFSFLTDKCEAPVRVEVDGADLGYAEPRADPVQSVEWPSPPIPPLPTVTGAMISVPLRRLAWGRSGDKGDNANIGIIPRQAAYAPWIWRSVTTEAVAERFAHFLKGEVERFFMPGTSAINYLLHNVLGGGGMASLRNDPQGKSYAQILLDMPIEAPRALLERE